MEKKYRLTDEIISWGGKELHRIEALKNFGDVKAGDLGGFVESESNLLQIGNCWIYDNAKVLDNVKIIDNAVIKNNVIVMNNTVVKDYAVIIDNATIMNTAKIKGLAQIIDNVVIAGSADIGGNARITGNAKIYDNARIEGFAVITNNVRIYGDVIVNGHIIIKGNCELTGDARISKLSDYIVFENWWSSGRFFTWTRSNDMWSVGCFYGTGKELIKKAYNDSELSGDEYKRVVEYVESIKNK